MQLFRFVAKSFKVSSLIEFNVIYTHWPTFDLESQLQFTLYGFWKIISKQSAFKPYIFGFSRTEPQGVTCKNPFIWSDVSELNMDIPAFSIN